MNLKEKFQIDLHSGKEINGMQRHNGYYLGQEVENIQTILFDNGNLYFIKNGEIIKLISGENEYFIDKHIIKAIYNLIILNPLFTENFKYSESNYDNVIEFYAQNIKEKQQPNNCLIKIHINRNSKRIDISNIMTPLELKHNSFGKKMIYEIYNVAKKHKYKLQLVQMMEGFYNRMIKRGAKIVYKLDTVEITENTKLN